VRILFCKTFGIGNAVMAIPTIRALKSLGHHVDVLCGDTSDDVGAVDVFREFKRNFPTEIDDVKMFAGPTVYDLAILSIPYDGRWKNGVHFDARQTVDGRTRPDPTTTGLVSWKKSELEYQLDNARQLGWDGETPSSKIFHRSQLITQPSSYYFGVGYKKDLKNFWSVKHWGNENFIELGRKILTHEPNSRIYFTGDDLDLKISIAPIIRGIGSPLNTVYVPTSSVQSALKIVSSCETYVGNDTGMMHVAAAAGCNVLGLFFLENSHVKNPPAGESSTTVLHDYQNRPTPDRVFEELQDL
jgi:ADP-heptose:LPS heptosyltransferase